MGKNLCILVPIETPSHTITFPKELKREIPQHAQGISMVKRRSPSHVFSGEICGLGLIHQDWK